MIVVNLSHPLTDSQREQLERASAGTIVRVVHRACHFDHERPFGPQVRALVDSVGLSADDWQRARLLLVPPSFAPIAACVLAEVHGRAGYFPPIVRLRPIAGRVPPEFEIAEIVDLQAIRNDARTLRGGPT